MARMTKVVESLALEGNSLPILFLRSNTDNYYIDDKLYKTDRRIRERKLLDLIKNFEFDENSPLLQIQYMHYDCNTLSKNIYHLKIHDDPDYDEYLQNCCLPPIVK